MKRFPVLWVCGVLLALGVGCAEGPQGAKTPAVSAERVEGGYIIDGMKLGTTTLEVLTRYPGPRQLESERSESLQGRMVTIGAYEPSNPVLPVETLIFFDGELISFLARMEQSYGDFGRTLIHFQTVLGIPSPEPPELPGGGWSEAVIGEADREQLGNVWYWATEGPRVLLRAAYDTETGEAFYWLLDPLRYDECLSTCWD